MKHRAPKRLGRPWEWTLSEVQQALDCIGDRTLIASVSGGKDSTALALLFKLHDIPYRAVHQDTGWESIETDHYVRDVLPAHIGAIEILRAEVPLSPEVEAVAGYIEALLGKPYSAMVRLALRKGMFSNRRTRYCTQELKIFPLRGYLETLEDEPLNSVGIRWEESARRSKYPEWEWSGTLDCEVWRPMLDWTEADVIDLHKVMGVPPNPLYLRGSARVGCWPCLFSRKHEIRMMAESDPRRVVVIEALERAVTWLAAERYAAKGEALPLIPSFFESRRSLGPRTLPIREVIAWSRTRRGSAEIEPYAPLPHEAGCTRWGLCDTSWRLAPEPPEGA